MTLQELQGDVDGWIKDHGVRYFGELTNLGVLMEEVGELSRLLTRTYGEQSFKEGREPENIKETIADEMADVLFVLTCLANQTGIDLTEAMKKNLIKKTGRDQDRHKGNEKLK